MSNGPLIKIGAETAEEVCANFALKDEAKPLLRKGMSPREFVAALVGNKRYLDAIDFLAHALPPREGIWWGCLCIQHAFGEGLNPADRAAATAAVQWVLQPTEASRVAAKDPAEVAGPTSPAGALAVAAFQTGGNIAPPNAPPQPPPPFGPAKAVARAVKLASLKNEPVNIAKVQRCYVDLALEVAEGHLI